MKTPNHASPSFLVAAVLLAMAAGTADTVNAADATTVQTTAPQQKTLRRTTSQPATVLPLHEAEIHAKVAGYLKELKADIGDTVKAGQALAVIDVPEMVKAYERQNAETSRLETEITRAEATLEVSGALVKQASADLQKAEARLAAEQSEFERAEKLVENRVVTQKVFDEAENRLRATQAGLASARENLNVSRARENASKAELKATYAAATVARKTIEEMEVMMGYATLKAPFDGIVTQRLVDPGDLVRNSTASSGPMAPLFTVSRADRVRVQVPVPEKDAVWVDAGDDTEIRFSAFPDRTFTAKVTRTSRRLDPQTRTLLVEIELENPEDLLLPGMYGTVVIVMAEKNALVLPAQSIRFDKTGENSMVYVVKNGGTIAHVPVKTGLDDGHFIEIVSGLEGGEQIVTGMLGRLQDGERVTVLER